MSIDRGIIPSLRMKECIESFPNAGRCYHTESNKLTRLITVPERVFTLLYLRGARCDLIVFGGSDCRGPGGITNCQKYWENALRQKWGQAHEGLRGAESLAFVWPQQFHIDDASIYNGSSYQITSVSSPFATGNTFDIKFTCCVLDVDYIIQGETDVDIADYLAWCGDIAPYLAMHQRQALS